MGVRLPISGGTARWGEGRWHFAVGADAMLSEGDGAAVVLDAAWWGKGGGMWGEGL